MANKKKIKKFKTTQSAEVIETVRLGDLLQVPFSKTKSPLPTKIDIDPKTNARSFNSSVGEAEIWLSKKGRAGKIASLVTLTGLNDEEKKDLFKRLKQNLACGISKKKDSGEWVVQTSNREAIKNFFEKNQIKSKLCGG